MIAISVYFTNFDAIISYEFPPTMAANSTDIAVQEQQFNATSTDKGYAYKLQVRAEGMDQQDVNVTSSANIADGIRSRKGVISLFIVASILKQSMFIGLVTIVPK